LCHPIKGRLFRKDYYNKLRSHLRSIGILPQLRILYLSCHSILEYDEINLFREIGYHVFSPGDYVDKDNPGKPLLRRYSEKKSLEEIADLQAFNSFGSHGPENKNKLIKSFVDRFDIIIVMHMPQWITLNWEVMKHKVVIWRTIGQSTKYIEESLYIYRLQGLKIVRYSPLEKNIQNYIGDDTVIRFYKDPNEYFGWNGRNKSIMTISQEIGKRTDACHFDLYKLVVSHFDSQLFGPGNQNIDVPYIGEVSHNELIKALQEYRCYLYTGTFPASYTLGFIEAWMTGIPIVSIGNKLMHDRFTDEGLYEIPKLIINGENGFYADSIEEIKNIINLLMNNHTLASKISQAGRISAIKYFGKHKIKSEWHNFLNNF